MTGEYPIMPDELRALDGGLARAARALDREIADSGAVDRVARRVMTRVAAGPPHRRALWFAVAATLVVAAGLGSLADVAFTAGSASNQEVVVVDPLIFGTAVMGQE